MASGPVPGAMHAIDLPEPGLGMTVVPQALRFRELLMCRLQALSA